MTRHSDYPVHSLILNRWSPRAMSGEELTDEELMSLFEAARFAPSSYNGQPWRFLYAKRKTDQWNALFELLVPFNKSWADDAAALVLLLSRKNFIHNEKPSATHSFDAGAAWQNLALEASSKGLVAHGMQGFDYDQARETLSIPNAYAIEMMIALGKPGKKEDLPEEAQKKEAVSDRNPLTELVFDLNHTPSLKEVLK